MPSDRMICHVGNFLYAEGKVLTNKKILFVLEDNIYLRLSIAQALDYLVLMLESVEERLNFICEVINIFKAQRRGNLRRKRKEDKNINFEKERVKSRKKKNKCAFLL
jgi:prefoldin subunit 5